jgi:hypothetical protein
MYFDGAREIADRIIDAVIRLKGGEDAKTVMGELNDQATKIVEANHLK